MTVQDHIKQLIEKKENRDNKTRELINNYKRIIERTLLKQLREVDEQNLVIDFIKFYIDCCENILVYMYHDFSCMFSVPRAALYNNEKLIDTIIEFSNKGNILNPIQFKLCLNEIFEELMKCYDIFYIYKKYNYEDVQTTVGCNHRDGYGRLTSIRTEETRISKELIGIDEKYCLYDFDTDYGLLDRIDLDYLNHLATEKKKFLIVYRK